MNWTIFGWVDLDLEASGRGYSQERTFSVSNGQIEYKECLWTTSEKEGWNGAACGTWKGVVCQETDEQQRLKYYFLLLSILFIGCGAVAVAVVVFAIEKHKPELDVSNGSPINCE